MPLQKNRTPPESRAVEGGGGAAAKELEIWRLARRRVEGREGGHGISVEERFLILALRSTMASVQVLRKMFF